APPRRGAAPIAPTQQAADGRYPADGGPGAPPTRESPQDSGKCRLSAMKPTSTPPRRATEDVRLGRLRMYSSLEAGMPNHSGRDFRIRAHAPVIDASKGTISRVDPEVTTPVYALCLNTSNDVHSAAAAANPRRHIRFLSRAWFAAPQDSAHGEHPHQQHRVRRHVDH